MTNQGQNLIFLISQPRSGSTMTQRILGAHSQIHTQSEPWIMLHPLNALKSNNIQTSYDMDLYLKGAVDFIDHLPGKRNLYKAIISDAYCMLYNSILEKEGKGFFLDKTPRYYYIIEELADFFPEAKFIFLWRNPAAVLTSIVKTWSKADWYRLSEWKEDLLNAPQWMLDGIKHLKNRAFVLNYEDLLKNPYGLVENVCKFLAVPFQENIIEYGQFKVPEWQYGDQGTVNYKGKPDISHEDNWHEHLNNPQLWRVIYDYMGYLGSDIISAMGYNLGDIEIILEQNKPNLDVNIHTLPLAELLFTNRSVLIDNKRLQRELKNAFEGLRNRDENLKTRNETISQKDRVIGEKDKIIQQSKIELSKSQAAIEEKTNLIGNLQSVIIQKDKHIEQSTVNLNSFAKNLSDIDILLENHNNELTKLKDELSLRLLQIEKRSEEINELNIEVNSLKLSLKDKELQVEQLSSAITSLNTALKDKDLQVGQLGSAITSLKITLKDQEFQVEKKDEIIANQLKELQSIVLIIKQLNEQNDKNFHQLKEQNNIISQLKAEMDSSGKQLEQTLAYLADSRKQLQQKDEILMANSDALREKSKLLTEKQEQLKQRDELLKRVEQSYTFKIGKAIVWPIKKIAGR